MYLVNINRPDDVQNILSGKLALRYAGREAEALKAIAQSAIKRSLAQFQQVRNVSVVLIVWKNLNIVGITLGSNRLPRRVSRRPHYQGPFGIVVRYHVGAKLVSHYRALFPCPGMPVFLLFLSIVNWNFIVLYSGIARCPRNCSTCWPSWEEAVADDFGSQVIRHPRSRGWCAHNLWTYPHRLYIWSSIGHDSEPW